MDSPLLIAISNSNYKSVEFLLENGANPNSNPDKVYTLPLNLTIDTAVETTKNNIDEVEDSTDIIKPLLEFGAKFILKIGREKALTSSLKVITFQHRNYLRL